MLTTKYFFLSYLCQGSFRIIVSGLFDLTVFSGISPSFADFYFFRYFSSIILFTYQKAKIKYALHSIL